MEGKKKPSELLSEMLALTDQTTIVPNTSLELAEYVEKSGTFKSYCSITQLLSPSDPVLQKSFNVAMYWRADISKKDFHVTQKMFDAKRSKWLYDSWVCKGLKAWRTMPFWIQFDREMLDPFNQVLTITPALAVAKAAISSVTVKSKEVSSYAIFYFDLPRSEAEIWSPNWGTASSKAQVRLWFTLDQGHLARMEVGPFDGIDGQGVSFLDQVFACHDKRIKIRGPRWINAEKASDGRFRILKNRYVDIVTHFGEEPEPQEIHMEEDAEDLAEKKDAEFGSEVTFMNEFLQSYYQSPKSESEIVSFLRTVVAGGYLDDLNVQKTFAPFMAVIFSKYPDRVEEWASEIKNEDVQTRVLELSNSIDDLIDDPPSVSNNDECWGAYFASGDIRFIDKLIETTRYISSSSNPVLMLAADTAKWSLASNAERHMKVWGAIESAVEGGREDLQGLLTEDPEVLLARMRDAYKEIDVPDGVDNTKWKRISDLASPEIFKLQNRANGERLFNLVLSSLKLSAQMKRKRDKNECDFYSFIRFGKVTNEELVYTVLYMGKDKCALDKIVNNYMMKTGDYLSVEIPIGLDGYYLSTLLVEENNTYLEDWLWMTEEDPAVLYQAKN